MGSHCEILQPRRSTVYPENYPKRIIKEGVSQKRLLGASGIESREWKTKSWRNKVNPITRTTSTIGMIHANSARN